MPILHVRNVPEEIYAELKARAQTEGRSLSAQVIIMLEQALRQPARPQSEVLAALDTRRYRFSPRKAGAPSSTELLRQDRSRYEEAPAMTRMVRKQIYIEPQQEALLKRLVRITGVTEAEIIRRAIEQQVRGILFPHRDLSAWQEERAFINHLIQQGPVPGGRTWHREDLYER